MPEKNRSNEIKITRVYDAPIAAVWDAWTDPVQTAQWWGPRGFTITTHSKDLRPGGHWHYTMHGPDGTDYINKTKYFEVEEHSKLVYDHGGNDEQAPLFRVTVLFSASGKKTRMEMTMALPTADKADETRKFIKKAGGNGTWDRLAEFLEKGASGKEKFVINRSFEAPVDAVFEMWSDPRHFSKWLPPAGFKMEFIRADIRPGGAAFWQMTDGKDVKMHGRFEYLKIERPNLLIYLQQFADENEEMSRHPFAAIWPEKMLITVELSPEHGDMTRVTLTCEPYGKVSPAELEAFIKERGGMTAGWTGSFDKLEMLLQQ